MSTQLTVDQQRLRAVCERYGVQRLELFGSVASGEDSPASDIDLLYTLQPGRHLGWEIEDLNDELTQLFGRPVDLASRNGLHPALEQQVLNESTPF